MLLGDARRDARAGEGGEVVPLPEQDRARWDTRRLAEGRALVWRCLAWNRPGPYQIQAAIQAVHSDAPSAAETDWGQIVALYDQLSAVAPSPVVALNRAVAVAEVDGPAAALELVNAIDLGRYHVYHAVRADLLRRLGRPADAVRAYDRAIELAGNAREREFLARRRGSLGVS
jgi:RNA polymerase sigma-70 factor (ECF subfamily)